MYQRCGPSLQRISLYWNVQLTNAAAISLARRCPRLAAVCLSGCKKVGSAGVRAFAARGATLSELDLTRLPLLADDALVAVVGACVLSDLWEAAAIVFFFATSDFLQTWCVHHTAAHAEGLSSLLPETVSPADGSADKPLGEVAVGEL